MPRRKFRNTFGRCEVRPSARKHGAPVEDTWHAWTHALIAYPIGADGDPPRELRLGPDRAGNRLELDAIGGAVVRAAGRHGIPVPVTSRYVDELSGRYRS